MKHPLPLGMHSALTQYCRGSHSELAQLSRGTARAACTSTTSTWPEAGQPGRTARHGQNAAPCTHYARPRVMPTAMSDVFSRLRLPQAVPTNSAATNAGCTLAPAQQHATAAAAVDSLHCCTADASRTQAVLCCCLPPSRCQLLLISELRCGARHRPPALHPLGLVLLMETTYQWRQQR
jgi:hypothetical protein